MFFPAESDALSPLNTYVIPHKPPPVPLRTLDLNSMHGPSITAMSGPGGGWCAPEVPTYLDLDLILK